MRNIKDMCPLCAPLRVSQDDALRKMLAKPVSNGYAHCDAVVARLDAETAQLMQPMPDDEVEPVHQSWPNDGTDIDWEY